MSKTALLKMEKPGGAVPGRKAKVDGEYRESLSRPSCRAEQPEAPAPTLEGRLRACFSSLTPLEASVLFTLVHRRDTSEDTLLKCAAGETGVSEALIVKIAKKLGFEGF